MLADSADFRLAAGSNLILSQAGNAIAGITDVQAVGGDGRLANVTLINASSAAQLGLMPELTGNLTVDFSAADVILPALVGGWYADRRSRWTDQRCRRPGRHRIDGPHGHRAHHAGRKRRDRASESAAVQLPQQCLDLRNLQPAVDRRETQPDRCC